jgi:hypothetical protein
MKIPIIAPHELLVNAYKNSAPTNNALDSFSDWRSQTQSPDQLSPDDSSVLGGQDSSAFSSSASAKQCTGSAFTTWEHARDPKEDELLRDKNGNRYFYCSYCGWRTASTTSARAHLKTVRHIDVAIEPSKAKKGRTELLEDTWEKTRRKKQENPELIEEVLRKAVNKNAFEEALIRLIIIRNLAHNSVE